MIIRDDHDRCMFMQPNTYVGVITARICYMDNMIKGTPAHVIIRPPGRPRPA